jgi:tRNA pseudouridine55 synthase
MNQSGVLVVNKPSGVTSHDVIRRLRKILGTRRIGHTGTLDPQASGVLLACVGKATKVVQFLSSYDKEYEAKIKLGTTTDSYDAQGEVTDQRDCSGVTTDQIRKAADSFRGKIWQLPPLHSAIKYKGKKLYQYARAKEKVELRKRPVEIKAIQVSDVDMPYASLSITCSKGTYVRSLAHDLGGKLGCGAHLFSLRRTRVGPFTLQQASDMEAVSRAAEGDALQDVLFPMERALDHLPAVMVEGGFAQRVRHGTPLLSTSVLSVDGDFHHGQTVSLRDSENNILALGRALCSSGRFLDPDHKGKLIEYIRVI